MNDRIRHVGVAVTLGFVAVFAMLNWLQIVQAKELASDPLNIRPIIRDYAAPRGDIVTSDGVVLATSVPIEGQFDRQRTYPTGPLFGQVTGWFSFAFGASGVEREYNSVLSGRDPDLRFRNVTDLVLGRATTGDVVLTLQADAQELARQALNGRRGSVVVIEPATGRVIALYSEPALDPNPLSAPDFDTAQAAFDAVEAEAEATGADPRLARSYRERFPPGSTFKVVTASWAIQTGLATPDTQYPVIRELDLPQTDRTLPNFADLPCGGTMAQSLAASCNTTFGQIGLDLGENLITGMHAFGIGDPVPFDLPGAATASIPPAGSFELNMPSFAFAAIGQGDVSVSPLQMATVAAGIANDGVIMTPYAVDRILDRQGDTVRETNPAPWLTAVSPETAESVTQMMIGVVENGTGRGAQIPGITVAGKTGTAQVPGGNPHTWFIGFAPAEAPQYAIAVIIENGGDIGADATGGGIAAPAAQQVLAGLLAAG